MPSNPAAITASYTPGTPSAPPAATPAYSAETPTPPPPVSLPAGPRVTVSGLLVPDATGELARSREDDGFGYEEYSNNGLESPVGQYPWTRIFADTENTLWQLEHRPNSDTGDARFWQAPLTPLLDDATGWEPAVFNAPTGNPEVVMLRGPEAPVAITASYSAATPSAPPAATGAYTPGTPTAAPAISAGYTPGSPSAPPAIS